VYSRRRWGELDQRTAEALEERRIIEALTAHVGNNPTAPQQIMIRRAARVLIMVTLLERRVIENPGDFGDLALRQLCALSNSARLAMQAIGFDQPERTAPEIADFLVAQRKRDAAA
jgi:hypothetical protein